MNQKGGNAFVIILSIFALVIIVITAWYSGKIAGYEKGLNRGYNNAFTEFQAELKKGIQIGHTFWIGDIEFVPRKDKKYNIKNCKRGGN